MKFIHTADWHLGKLLHGVHLTEDQAHVLAQFLDLVESERPDAVIIAGDVYDRAIPPPEAINLLDDTLSRLVLDLQVPTLIIAGNHDSPDRLAFGSRILAERGLLVVCKPTPAPRQITLNDQYGQVSIYPIPYADPAAWRQTAGDESLVDHHTALQAVVDRCRDQQPANQRSVLIAHAFVTGGQTSDSERPLTVGGTGAVDSRLFEGFDYVALGHLHRPQSCSSDQISYAGSLLKYSFAEADHSKSVSLVELDGSGNCQIEHVQLQPRHDLRRLRGRFSEILTQAAEDQHPNDYLEITLTDPEPVFSAMARLRERYPNLLHVGRELPDVTEFDNALIRDYRQQSDTQLFKSFYSQVTSEEMIQEQVTRFEQIIQSQLNDEEEPA